MAETSEISWADIRMAKLSSLQRQILHRRFADQDTLRQIGQETTIWLGGEVDLGTALVRRVGKKTAGRLLDGREWDEFPVVQ